MRDFDIYSSRPLGKKTNCRCCRGSFCRASDFHGIGLLDFGGDLLALRFFLSVVISLLPFSESNRKYFYYSIVFYILAILSSEKALVLFLIFALYELAFGSLRYNWKKIAPFVLISFLILFLYIGKIGYRV